MIENNQRATAAKTESVNDEIVRRHRVAANVVLAMLALTGTLVAIASVAGERFQQSRAIDPTLILALQVIIPLVFGLGAIAFRRTKFMALRLQDIASVRGTSALIYTLQRTTIMVALLGGAIAIAGFTSTVLTGEREGTFRAGLIAVAVLIYCYPRRAAWQRVVEQMQTPDDAAIASSAKGTTA